MIVSTSQTISTSVTDARGLTAMQVLALLYLIGLRQRLEHFMLKGVMQMEKQMKLVITLGLIMGLRLPL